MSKEGERATVFLSTKVRTKLKGDSSWMQRQSDPQPQEEKPWIAEVRASRLNGAPIETSPVSSPTKPTPSSIKPVIERPPTSGYLIRGVFTKTNSKPAPSSTSNGSSGTTNVTKKPSESYKRIAPHTVRPTSDIPAQTEWQLSAEEQERRTEAASNVLKTSAVRQRSYVLSAARKYESIEKAPDTSPVNSSPSFVAKRVELTDDDETAETPAPAIAVTSPAAAPEPTAQPIVETSVDVTVDEPVAPAVEDIAPEPVKDVTWLVSLTEHTKVVTPEKDPFEHMTPGCTKVAAPLPELVLESFVEVCRDPEPDDSVLSGKDDAPLLAPVPVSPAPVSAVTEDTVKTDPEPEPSSDQSSSVDTLTALSDTLISFSTSSASLIDTQEENDVSDPIAPAPDSFKNDEPALAEEEGGPVESNIEDSAGQEPTPELSNCTVMTDDLLALTNGPEELPEPTPPSPGRWSHELLSGPGSLSDSANTSDTLDLLADDVIPINTEAHSLSTEQEEEKQTDETAKGTQSLVDPFDPYPIGTTSPNSSSDLLQPLSTHPINSSTDLMSPTDLEEEDPSPEINMSANALESLAEDIIPIDTDTKRLSTGRSWTRTWESSTPQYTTTEESHEAVPAGHVEDQQTLVTFERKSTENDSPWDRWTSPTIYTTTNTTEEEEEEDYEEEGEEESPEDTETVTTITTIRETYSDPEPAMDRYETYSRTLDREDDQRVQTPEPESKKGFVYVKEYVNTTQRSGSDYLTSSSSTYSRDSMSSTCTYCGELVGNDAKITIEHLNINCHPACFKCDVCSKPMGDLIHSLFLHGGRIHCESCYSKALD